MDKESADAAAEKASEYHYSQCNPFELSVGRRHPRQSWIPTFARYTQPPLDRELLLDRQDPQEHFFREYVEFEVKSSSPQICLRRVPHVTS